MTSIVAQVGTYAAQAEAQPTTNPLGGQAALPAIRQHRPRHTYHRPATYATAQGQIDRLRWMLKICEIKGLLTLADFIQVQLDEVWNKVYP